MTAKNFNIKNGLSVGGVEVITSAGRLTGTAITDSIDDRVNTLLTAGTGISLSYDDSAGTLTITGQQGDITGIVAGDGLTGDASSGEASLAVGAGTGISVSANAVAVDLKDEDDMSSNSATHAASQQSIKAYVDSQILTKDNTDEITEGSSNLYFTNARADARIANAIVDEDNMASNSATQVPSQQSVKAYVDAQVDTADALSELSGDSDDITEGSTNLFYTDARAQAVSIKNVVEDTTPQLGGNLDAQTYNITTTGKILYANMYSQESDLPSASTYHGMFAHVHGTGKGYFGHGGNWIKLIDESSSTTDNLSEGSTNLYHTNERVDDRVNALIQAGTNITTSYDDAAGTLTINSSGKTEEEIEDIVNGLIVGGTGISSTYDDSAGTLTLATSITQYADSDARGAISVTDSGGDGSLAYNNSTGVITYTGPSASEVRAHISGGTGVSVSSGEISIGQAVATSSDVTFADIAATGNVTITGNLDVNGTTTTLDSTNSTIADRLIELGTGTTGTPANDMGLVLERGSSDNAFIGWDESADKFLMGTGSFTGASTGNLTVSTGTLVANLEGNVTGAVTGNADTATALATARTIGLSGDVSGSASFDGSANITISATVADDSHNHVISNVDGLQTALDTKYESGDNISVGTIASGAITITNATNAGGTARNIYQSTSTPGSSDGAVGDLWIYYS